MRQSSPQGACTALRVLTKPPTAAWRNAAVLSVYQHDCCLQCGLELQTARIDITPGDEVALMLNEPAGGIRATAVV